MEPDSTHLNDNVDGSSGSFRPSTSSLQGVLAPRNVRATRNIDNPKRSILVTFDAPEKGPPLEYKIVAIPEYGKRKTFFCSTNTMLVEFLRKGIKYSFEVHARHGSEWSEGSLSNYQETDRGDENGALVNFSGIGESVIDMRNAQIHGHRTNVDIPKEDNFGKARDLVIALTPHEREEKDILTLSWKVPMFGNYALDYKVESYKVEIRKKNAVKCNEFKIDFNKNLDKYSTDIRELDLGEKYEISVSTTYTDIDQDEEYTSSGAKATVQTRPCKPNGIKSKVIKNDKGEEALKIEWNAAKGANQYEVEIYTDASEEPLYRDNMASGTTWLRNFDEGFTYGTSYCAVIIVIGEENKTNFFKTAWEKIGGDLFPRQLHATVQHEQVVNPSTQVYLSWEPPGKQPETYEVTYENEGKSCKILCEEIECLIDGLLAGCYYTFEVVAIHNNKVRSGRCVSDEIRTHPKPTKVMNVLVMPGNNPTTSAIITWDRANDESFLYKVAITASNRTTNREINNVGDKSIHVFGLDPDTEYLATVVRTNSEDSGKCVFRTETGKPRNVHLLNNLTSPSTSVILKFSEADGKPLKYYGGLSKYQEKHKGQDEVVEVKSGHIFDDLKPNTKYFAVLYTVFENEKDGKPVISDVILTAPPKPEIVEYHCCVGNGINSSKSLFLKWESDTGCMEHEVQIKHGDKVENQRIVEQNYLKYFCQHEASLYTARVRTKNQLYGPWSDEAVIYLAPAKLKDVAAKLENDGSKVLIQCQKAPTSYLSYFCQVICNNIRIKDPIMLRPEDADNIVCFMFEPTEHAQKYYFKLWAADNRREGLEGESTLSEYVISKPAPGRIISVERTKENPSSDIIISCEPLKRCDEYEVEIRKSGQFESCIKTTEVLSKYRCHCPGSKYDVRVRGICKSVLGAWSNQEIVSLKWNIPVQLSADLDPNDSRKATISWDKPDGVNCYRLEIEHFQTGKLTVKKLKETVYVLKSGLPGNSYAIRLYSGCDEFYDDDFVELELTMGPGPPTLLKAEADKSVNGITVTLKDHPDSEQSYEVHAVCCSDCSVVEKIVETEQDSVALEKLVPGASYEVSALTRFKNMKSKKATFASYIQTYPDDVKNLRSRQDGKSIIYEWDPLKIPPEEYKVEWGVTNNAVKDDFTKETKFEILRVDSGQSYRLRVMATNSAGNGKKSAWCKITAEKEITNTTSIEITPNKEISNYLKDVVSKMSDGISSGVGVSLPAASRDVQDFLRTIASAMQPGEYNEESDNWINVTGTGIWYNPEGCLREDSKVFEAVRKAASTTDEKLAIKFVTKFLPENIREAENILVANASLYVVKYYQSGRCKYKKKDAFFILMERCEEDTLWDRIRKGNPCYAERKEYVRCIAEGLLDLKKSKIMHRDLKPHNILFRNCIAKISDFGLSKKHPKIKSNAPQSRDRIGTSGWIAPEAYLKGGKTSYPADVFSAGLVFSYTLTGKHPYGDGDDMFSWQTYIKDDVVGTKHPKDLQALYGTLDGAIAFDLTDSMLKREPEERPSIDAVLKHPFFWNEEKRLNFFSDVCKNLELVKTRSATATGPIFDLNTLDEGSGKYWSKAKTEMVGWKDKLVIGEQDAWKRKAASFGNNVTDLLRFIRNRHAHDPEDKGKGWHDMTEEEFYTFFSEKFPHFFIYIFCWFKRFYDNKSDGDVDYYDKMATYFSSNPNNQ